MDLRSVGSQLSEYVIKYCMYSKSHPGLKTPFCHRTTNRKLKVDYLCNQKRKTFETKVIRANHVKQLTKVFL